MEFDAGGTIDERGAWVKKVVEGHNGNCSLRVVDWVFVDACCGCRDVGM